MKRILITGAGKGIGLELVKQASDLGHQIIAISRNINALKSIPNTIPLSLDLTKPDFESSLITILADKSLDIIINNAGLLINKPFLELTDSDWDLQWKTNVLAPVRLIRAIKNHLTVDAHIVNISSMGGFQGSSKFAGLSAYSSTKGALSILSESLVEEPEFKGISINALCLGAAQTEMLAQAFPGYQAPVSAHKMANYILDFALKAGSLINGKIIPLAKNNPT